MRALRLPEPVEAEVRYVGGVDPARVLVAVPALNEQRHIEACLRSLIAGPFMQGVDVVVADGGSDDRTRAITFALMDEFPKLALIDNPGRLQSAALNRVVARCATSGHDILVRCDAHAVYPPGYVRDVAASLMRHGTASVATAMDAGGPTCFQRGAGWVADSWFGAGGARHRGGRRSMLVDHAHHAGFDLGWLRLLGGYDESFSHNEDAEFDHRLRRAGGRIWLDAGIRLSYQMRGSFAALARQYWHYGRGRARMLVKHRARPRLRQMIPPLHVLALGGSLALVPFGAVGLVYPTVYGAGVVGASLWAVVRHRSACGLWAGPAAAAMHAGWGAGFLWQAAVRGARA
jgi:succinoglycan biosynthesis protein ExoA